jgi:hypothetical protein
VLICIPLLSGLYSFRWSGVSQVTTVRGHSFSFSKYLSLSLSFFFKKKLGISLLSYPLLISDEESSMCNAPSLSNSEEKAITPINKYPQKMISISEQYIAWFQTD